MKGLIAKNNSANGSGLKILIVHTRWNLVVVQALVEGCKRTLMNGGVSPEDITVHDVAGCFELPFATQSLLKKGNYDAAISIGTSNLRRRANQGVHNAL
jgi:6,7-dimethyl-8-ribityllumazine synthase